ncbi:fimbrial protein [Escherichia coli]|nr:fimbrial protein [Escherichia coli O140]EFH8174235.1 fimbrial protein [Escherichia coli]EFH8737815.1 fimbrial protein [Escherichia coli]EGR7368565.1 fimbrial protein [Escherichia coli]EHB6110759.1 fimbrial protein [Escherichia coli]
MMLKRGRVTGLGVAASLLLTAAQALAVDIPIKITGTIQIPPCQVNDGKTIVVEFGDVSVTDVANERNRRKVTVPVKCSYAQGTAYVKVTGTQLGSNTNVLKTDVDNFGIALYQGDGTTVKLVLGDGKHNGQDSIGYPIQAGLSGKESGTFTFTAIPFKEGDKDLAAGAFLASANMSISYF